MDRKIPTQVGDEEDWMQISGVGHTSLALKDDGTVWAWGYNNYGQVGDGSGIDRYEPVQIMSVIPE